MNPTGLAGRCPLTILLAEDNAVNQELALKLLQRMGYTADVAVNGVEAVAAVERQRYDVVLMDVQMPELDGLEATRRIIAQHEFVAVLLDSFSEDAPRLLQQLRAGLGAGDRESVQRAAHTLKSNAQTFGASHLASLCAELEAAVRTGHLPEDGPL